MLRGGLSSRSATNLVCRRWFSPVHSRNSTWATSTGFSHRQSFIFAAVMPAPHRLLFASGRFTNGQSQLQPAEFLRVARDGGREAVAGAAA